MITAEFDFLALMDHGDGLTHGAQLFTGDDADIERIGFGVGGGSRGGCLFRLRLALMIVVMIMIVIVIMFAGVIVIGLLL